MPIIIALLALLAPRIVILILWLFTGWFEGVFDVFIWPLLGFILLPTTLLWYSAVVNWFGGEWTLIPVVVIIVTILIDLSPAAGRRRALV